MLAFLLVATLVSLQPCRACNILGFKYIPPADTRSSSSASSSSTSTRQSCVPCSRGLGGGPSPRFGWPPPATTAATTAATATTAAPCCAKLSNVTGCGEVNTRIVGGEAATENQFPWQCAILNSDNSFYTCGATIISCDPVIIVSAAHCFQGANSNPNGKKVSCGGHMMAGQFSPAPLDTNEQRLSITQIINHPNYNDNTFENDVAVIKVSGSFTCSKDKIYPACLPNSERYTYIDWQDTIVSGWGTSSVGGQVEDTLRWVKVPPVSDATCNDPAIYNGQITANMICAGFATGGKDACQGDSGGPLVSRNTGVDTGYSLIGIVSWGEGCAGVNRFGVYAEVSYFLSWIAQQYDLSI